MSYPADVALRALEKLVNGALAFDPATRQKLARLTDRSLAVEMTLPPLAFALGFSAEGTIKLSDSLPEPPDVTLTGNSLALAFLAMASDPGALSRTTVDISGDESLLMEIRYILQHLDIDWEAALALLVGDTLAHVIGSSVRKFHDWSEDAGNRSLSGIAENLREETDFAVGKREAESWFHAVSTLVADNDRLSARVEKLCLALDKEDSH